MANLATLSRATAALLAAMCLAGCGTMGDGALTMSSGPSEIPPAAAAAIAGDMVGRLSERIGPARPTVQLKTDGSPFSQALQSSLKSWGYGVVTDGQAQTGPTITLAYVVEPMDGQYLARLSTSDFDLGRFYRVTTAGAAPSSPLSVLERGQMS
ncbi:conjugal transfer protein TrbH [Xanthobacter sp. DSM 24535]|uniref:Conjugative transfer protein TrbH n=1 Tax=Aquabacter spiritensis TaxID=933073 RepID=A0A4R3LNB9_9HYPH|nr:conjugal transfer protein TrbH [Aquabacter spiritensis]TCT01864.1 conjugative transfer protein TrbH [Aquabacter spiritensis]